MDASWSVQVLPSLRLSIQGPVSVMEQGCLAALGISPAPPLPSSGKEGFLENAVLRIVSPNSGGLPLPCATDMADGTFPEAFPLDAGAPTLGMRRISFTSDGALAIQLFLPADANVGRALGTASRLAALVHVWRLGGILLHGAGISDGSHAFVAFAPSGGGKSTFSSLSDGFDSLSDETVALVPEGNHPMRWLVWGSCFRSDSHKQPNPLSSSPLGALLSLEKRERPELYPLDGIEPVRRILRQTYLDRCLGPNPQGEALRRIASVTRQVPTFSFRFPKSAAAVGILLGQTRELIQGPG